MEERGNYNDNGFEKAWEEAFNDASQQPNPSVWSNIERELAYQQMAVLKKKARFYQWTAAAAIFIAAIFGINYLISYQGSEYNAYSQSPGVESGVESPISDDVFLLEEENAQNSIVAIPDSEDRTHEKAFKEIKNTGSNEHVNAIRYGDGAMVSDINEPEVTENNVPDYLALVLDNQSIGVSDIQYTIEPRVERDMYNRPISPKFIPVKTRASRSKEKFWAGVGMGSGSFDPNYQSGSSNLLANSLDLATAENYAVSNSFRIANQSPSVREGMRRGSSIDMGVNFGVRISDNWILESGVFYTQADATTQTNVVVESPNAVEPIAASSETRGVTQLNSIIGTEKFIQYNYQDVNLDNQFQFASVPLKAGFILIDNRLNITVNAGFATNFYLGNRLIDPNSEVANVSIGPGESSPYREISFAGLGGLQIGYAIFDHVQLTLEPYMRQPITSLTKQNTSFVASPSGYGINTGIRYRFN